VIEIPNIPEDILAVAHRRRNGELAWRPADAPPAVMALAAAAYAVLGGEWWVIRADGTIWPAVPATPPRTPMIIAWSFNTPWERMAESWQTFCEHAAAYTLAVLRGEDASPNPLPAIEAEVRRTHPDLWPRVWYSISYVDQSQYERLFPED
jgi:hypothetical protein